MMAYTRRRNLGGSVVADAEGYDSTFSMDLVTIVG